MADDVTRIASILRSHTCFLRSLGSPKYLCLCGQPFENEGEHHRHVAEIIAGTTASAWMAE